jgi:YVTN family beta-propeller protein
MKEKSIGMKTKNSGMEMRKCVLWLASVGLFLAGLVACDSTPLPDVDPTETALRGVFILSQGGNNLNEAGVWFYDPEKRTMSEVAMNRPGKLDEVEPLGDLGQDMLLYGGKLYVSVSNSSYVRVLDVGSRRTVEKILMVGEGDKPLNPRYMVAYEGKVYVTCWGDHSVVRIDTTSLKVDGRVEVGSYPEGIAACEYNGKLYVANSGAMMGHTVSVVDVASFRREGEIEVGLNPNMVKAGRESFLYVNYLGDYGADPGGFQRIDVETGVVTRLGAYPKNDFVWEDGMVYYYDATYGESGLPEISYGKFEVAGDSYLHPEKLIGDEGLLVVPFGIGVDPVGKTIYLADAIDFSNPGRVYVFDAEGERRDDFSVGVIPCKFAFY